ncbi:hypothetical protein [Streptomyces lydicus]|uniref:hypothetical protein n=1 Tax=Streptomyces lydicus TaxID=47763 RepID=UPI001013B822|nr:hypothetical protein [Streptomyces lydicus]MCZ1008681.1 hypothetical protein [Streptomyces lydicus]
MFEVRRSIRRYRDDPAWTYRKKARDYLATFDRGGYPFSLGPQGNGVRDLLQGNLRGQEVCLFHLNAWRRTGGSNRATVAHKFSVAVLPLPRVLPATAFTSRRLSWCAQEWNLPALPRNAGRSTDLPNLGSHLVDCCSVDPAFAALISTHAMERLMHKACMGWRIEENRMIAWTQGRKTYEKLLSLAETLATIIGDFPEQAWHWPETRGTH